VGAVSAVARRLRIVGRVQGVGYRDAMCREASRLGLAGWVRNRRDGTVEAQVEGGADSVARIVEWARRGPPAARVDGVEIDVAEPSGIPGFERRSSA
jgi:acylphosphatase